MLAMGLLAKLRSLFSGGPPPAPDAPPPASAPARPTGSKELRSRRVPDPMADYPGFDEVYSCPQCGDCFVLAWHPRGSPPSEHCDVISQRPGDPRPLRPGRARVFCPVCGTVYAMYGLIKAHGAASPARAEVTVEELLEFPFPPGVESTREGLVRIGGMTVERIVFLIRGTFPPDVDVRDFVMGGIQDQIATAFEGDLAVSQAGGIRVHVLRVSTLENEEDWLEGVLKRHVYRANPGILVFMTSPIMRIHPPMDQCMFCFVQSSRG